MNDLDNAEESDGPSDFFYRAMMQNPDYNPFETAEQYREYTGHYPVTDLTLWRAARYGDGGL